MLFVKKRKGTPNDDFIQFNTFINDNLLADLAICGRRFTWFLGDEYSLSHLDRFLLLEDWCVYLLNCIQIAFVRGFVWSLSCVFSVD